MMPPISNGRWDDDAPRRSAGRHAIVPGPVRQRRAVPGVPVRSPLARVCGPWAYLDVSRAAAALKMKGFSARARRSRPKKCGHTTEDGALAAARVHGVSVGARCGTVA